MSAPNPELATALAEADRTSDFRGALEERIKILVTQLEMDTFRVRAPSYSRYNYTAAVLFAGDVPLRSAAIAAGIDVKAFDNIVGQVQQLILTLTNKPAPGAKVAKVLSQMRGS